MFQPILAEIYFNIDKHYHHFNDKSTMYIDFSNKKRIVATIMKKIELLAPAGSYESLRAAINSGCDAIYFGIAGFNMRANSAKRFTLDDLKEIATICNENEIKCYLALNTLIYDANISQMREAIDAVKESGVDAIITFDTTAIGYAREKGVEVHISTQHSISNIESVKFFSQWADRMVLARELTLEQIKHITEEIEKQDVRGPSGNLVEIEIFIHGAMCVAVSGRCGMSLYMYNTSANCGKCSQPCRREFTITDKATGKQLDVANEYVMSTEDLCTIGMLDEILKSGAVSLKIEGRGRAPEYVDEVVRCYREAIEGVKDESFSKEKVADWNKRLGTVFNRGMSEGFYRGLAYKYWAQGSGSKATQKKELVGTVVKYYPKISVAEIKIHASDFKKGDKCIFSGEATGVLRVDVDRIVLDEKEVEIAEKGDVITMVVPSKVKANDKFYKFIS
jgi:U32 family peptidase